MVVQPLPNLRTTSQLSATIRRKKKAPTGTAGDSSRLPGPIEKMLSILRKAQLKDKEMRVLMLGLDNAGKTTIVKHIMEEDVNTVSPTLGFIIKTIDHKG